MKWYNQILLGVLLMSICVLSGCSSEDVILLKSSSGTITNNITNNITINNTYYINTTNNITNNITNNYTINLSYSSVQCTGTDKLNNVSFNGTSINGVCTTDQTGGGTTIEQYLNFDINGNLIDDFCGSRTTTGEKWYGTAIASGITGSKGGYANHPCIASIRSSTTANSGYVFNLGPDKWLLNGTDSTDIIFLKPSLSGNGSNASLGWFDTVTVAISTDGVYLHIRNKTAYGVVINNTVKYYSTTQFNITEDFWYRLRINITGGNQANFYLYNSTPSLGGGNTNLVWSSNVTGVIPSNPSTRQTGHGAMAYRTGGSSAIEILWLDYFRVSPNRQLLR